MHYCYLTTKNILGFKKNTKQMDFQIHKFLPFLVHPTMRLPPKLVFFILFFHSSLFPFFFLSSPLSPFWFVS
jgi:hypothetical protein